METKNAQETEVEKAGAEKAGTVKQARSVAGWISQVAEWIASVPVFLKPERIQKSGVVQRPRALEDARSLFDWVRAILDWIEKAPDFLLQLFGLRDNDPDDNDN